jgi:hypothetical protein
MISHTTPKFFFGAALASVVSLSLIIGPTLAAAHYLAPASFFARLVALIFCVFIAVVMAVPGFFLWLWIASKFENVSINQRSYPRSPKD